MHNYRFELENSSIVIECPRAHLDKNTLSAAFQHAVGYLLFDCTSPAEYSAIDEQITIYRDGEPIIRGSVILSRWLGDNLRIYLHMWRYGGMDFQRPTCFRTWEVTCNA